LAALIVTKATVEIAPARYPSASFCSGGRKVRQAFAGAALARAENAARAERKTRIAFNYASWIKDVWSWIKAENSCLPKEGQLFRVSV
jgi:hypothetical protein